MLVVLAKTKFDCELVTIACNLLREKYGKDKNGNYDNTIFQLSMMLGEQVIDYEKQTVEKTISRWDDNKHENVSKTINIDVIVAQLKDDGNETYFADKKVYLVEKQYNNDTGYVFYADYLDYLDELSLI